MTRSRYLSAVLLLALSTGACDRADTLGPDTEDLSSDVIASVLSAASADPRNTGNPGGTSLFDRLAGEIKSFAGLYRNGRCSIVVVLTDLSESEHAIRVVKAAIEQLVGTACPDGVRVQATQGRFTYVELQRYLTASRELRGIRGFAGSHLDYQRNRLVISVLAREVVPTITEALPRVGIPVDAVVFQLAQSNTGSIRQ
jgi:hypothetical protein